MTKIIEGVLGSRLLQREIPYRTILPANYNVFTARFPVIYLLHGLFGCCDNWLQLTRLTDYLRDKELIAVLPEGGDNWYTDSATIEENKFESYLIEELIPEIDALYKTDAGREKRAIAGLSMGGYGALKLGCKRPDLFAFAGSMSGAFDAPERSQNNPGFDWENLSFSILKVFGAEDSFVRVENDLFEIIKRISGSDIAGLPHFYIDCGTEDGFLETNRNLTGLLKQKMISFEYHEIEGGGHDWAYWDARLEYLLAAAAGKFGLTEPAR